MYHALSVSQCSLANDGTTHHTPAGTGTLVYISRILGLWEKDKRRSRSKQWSDSGKETYKYDGSSGSGGSSSSVWLGS